jgi:tRNA threonylcarbamoyladenosine biosynthesis protein TsaB
MKILALDSATGACSVALWQDGAILARRFAVMDRGQSEALIPMVREVLAEAGMDFPSIDAFGVTTGPGAFTGLRIGLAAARGMALASGRPLIGVSTFEAVAHGVPPEERQGRTVVVAVESRREDIFVQSFDSKFIALDEPRSVRPENLILPDTPVLVAGDGAVRLRHCFDGRSFDGSDGDPAAATRALATGQADIRFAVGPGFPDAADVARLVASRGLGTAGSAPPQPFYLRPPDVTLPTGKAR